MKKVFIMVIIACLCAVTCTKQEKNPFFSEWKTEFEVPRFDQISKEHYLPAFRKGIEQQKGDIEKIVADQSEPTFENTIEALEESGALLRKVSSVFNVLNGSMTDDEMQKIDEQVTPLLSNHRDDMLFNEALFQRIKTVHDQRAELDLTEEQATLLEKYYLDFVRGGANLSEEDKAELRKINEELSNLTMKFGQHVLKENNRYELVVESEEDLAGLPQSVIDGAAKAAKDRGHDGKWVFTLHRSSITPFLTYSEKRGLREEIFKAYINKGNHDDELDNKEIASRIAYLRAKRAHILGYETHAHYVLEENMAKKPENVYDLLFKIWEPALEKAKQERSELQKLIREEGKDFKLEPWDWWYYTEKLKKKKYDLSDEMIKPYFELNNVREGAFYVANQLYGIQFVERTDLPKYHPDVKVFEVKEKDGSHIGIFFADYYSRASKRGGAWMNSFRKQYRLEGKETTPIVTNNLNLTKPSGESPTLLTFDEATTLFHEFGHALHGLLSDCTYPRLSGTSVPRDFVELPSQIMEHWAAEPDVLKIYAKHYETGEPIPQELIDKIEKAGHFNQGFVTVEYVAASLLDMDWHILSEPAEYDALEFENKSMEKIGMIPEIVVRYRTPYFQHIFSGGYASGYYSYIWSEVLDCDAFHAFKETSLFDKETALSFRTNVLEKGGTQDPMLLYMNFRGKEPDVKYLLEKRGLN
ncbi:MAG: M3 family metallopeptidase [Candidatus Aminicenantes bacterium]|nr:M3 family metallopeptidase [Candidatus Aminicenantes bacterium]